MLNFSQETIYSILCAVLPCAIYYIIRKIKGQKRKPKAGEVRNNGTESNHEGSKKIRLFL